MDDKLFIVVPCYNEQEVILKTAEVLKNKLLKLIENNMISNLSRIMFVNDGSKDNTWGIIESLVEQDSIFAGVNLSRNKGHQNALLAGIDVASEYADIVISMDADLQDDINAIDKMLDAYAEGNEVVYGVRSSREKDTFFKKNTAQAFYKMLLQYHLCILLFQNLYPITNLLNQLIYHAKIEKQEILKKEFLKILMRNYMAVL